MAKYQRHKISYCPICGYVDLTNKETICNFCNSELENTTYFFDELCAQLESTDKEDIEEYVRQLYVYSDDRFNEKTMSDREEDKTISDQVDYYEELILNDKENECKCPICNSTKVKQISSTAKVAGAVAFGLFSKTARSQFECESCGYKW